MSGKVRRACICKSFIGKHFVRNLCCRVSLFLYMIGVLFGLSTLPSCRYSGGMEPLDAGSEDLLPFPLEDSVNSGDFSWLGEEDTLFQHFTALLQNRYQIGNPSAAREWVDQVNQAGVYAFVKGHTAQGLSLFLDALEVSMEFGIEDPYTQANLAMLYATVQDYDKAWDLSEQSFRMFEESGQYEEALLMIGNRLTCAMGGTSVPGVEWCLEKLESETYDTLPMACFSQCRARMFLGLQKKDYAEALHWAKASLCCGPNSVDTVAFYASVYQDIAMAFQGLEAYDSALFYYERSYAGYQQKQYLEMTQAVRYEQIGLYSLSGNTARYRECVQEYMELARTLQEKSVRSEQQNLDYVILQRAQERRMAELHYDSVYKGEIIRNQRSVFLSLTALLSLGLAFLFVLYLNKRRKERMNRLLYEKTRKLLALEHPKKEETDKQEDWSELPGNGMVSSQAGDLDGIPSMDMAVKQENAEGKAVVEEDMEDVEPQGVSSSHTALRMEEKQIRYIEYEIERLFDEEECYTQEDFTLDKLSKQLNSNTTYVSRIVNEHFHKSFSTLVNEYRIRKACLLLEDVSNTGYTLEYIAKLAGFGNRVTFTQQFKKQVGMTPSEYWKIAKNKAAETA